MLHTILVGLDGSPREAEVFARALALATADRATLHACRAVNVPVGMPDAVWTMPMAQLDQTLLEEAERSLVARMSAVPGAVTHVELGAAADVICDVASEIHADLVVIGSHGYGALERLLGTTASKVVNRAPCSVLVVRAPQ